MRLIYCALAIQLSVSANLLTYAGVPYVIEGGAIAFKIHPGNYIICAAFVLNCVEGRRSNRMLQSICSKNTFLVIYLGAISACLLYALLTTGEGNIIVLLDTFLPAGLVAAVLQNASSYEISTLRRLIQWGIAMNAMLALGEASQHASVVPLYLNNAEYHAALAEFRPTALYDHPLTGGVMTMMGFSLAPERLRLRSAYTCLLMAALLAFGGRVAVAGGILSWILVACIELSYDVLRRDSRACIRLVFFGLICTGCSVVAAGVLFAGLGARLGSHFYWDPSAQVRIAQWNLLSELSVPQIAFGTTRNDALSLLCPLWLSYGVEVIENFWLLMFVSLGVVGFCIFLPGFLCLLAWCWMRAGLRGRVLLVAVVLVASASNSLGRKSTLLVSLIAATLCTSKKDHKHISGLNQGIEFAGASTNLVKVS
jgi:hypothetical protein